jgi:hypothetical protein
MESWGNGSHLWWLRALVNVRVCVRTSSQTPFMVVVSFLEDLMCGRGARAQNGGPAGWARAGVGYALSQVRSASR